MARQTMYQTGAKLARLSRVNGLEDDEEGYGLNYDQGPASYYTEEQRNASSKRYDEAIKTMRDIRMNSTLAQRLNEDVANPQPKIAQIGWGKELKDVKLPGANLPASERLSEIKMTETEKRAVQLQNIAKDFATTDPKLSNEYFKQSLDMKERAAKEKSDLLGMQAEKLKQRADIAAMVVDQESLNEALPLLEGLGVKVPKEMTVFNKESQEFFKSRALMSSGFQKALSEQRLAEDLKRKEEKDAADIKFKEQEQKRKDQKLQLDREKMERARSNSSKLPKNSKFDTAIEMKRLEETEEKFADLPQAVKLSVASDVAARAYQLMQTTQMPVDEAKAQARKELLANIDEKGNYLLAPKATAKPATKFVEGKVYVDKNGNKAKYSNGKWIQQ